MCKRRHRSRIYPPIPGGNGIRQLGYTLNVMLGLRGLVIRRITGAAPHAPRAPSRVPGARPRRPRRSRRPSGSCRPPCSGPLRGPWAAPGRPAAAPTRGILVPAAPGPGAGLRGDPGRPRGSVRCQRPTPEGGGLGPVLGRGHAPPFRSLRHIDWYPCRGLSVPANSKRLAACPRHLL